MNLYSLPKQSWIISFLRRFFPTRILESHSDEQRWRYCLSKGPELEDVTDVALQYLLEPSNFSGRRRLLPCPKQFSELLFVPNSNDLVREGIDPLLQSVMPNPFVSTRRSPDEKYCIDVPAVSNYVQWLARRNGNSTSVIADQVLAFLTHIDVIMQESWREAKAYDINALKAELRPFRNEGSGVRS